MLYDKIKNDFNNSNDLKYEKINNIEVIYLESICSGDKINEYVLRNIVLKKDYFYLRDIISGPNTIYVNDVSLVKDFLLNGFVLVYDSKDMVVCEVKGDLYRSVSPPTSEPSVNGPKDSFVESIITNLGLIKRRIKSEDLVNIEMNIGKKTSTKVSILYLNDLANFKQVREIKRRLKKIDIDGLIDIEVLHSLIGNNKSPMPTIMKTERPDKACTALLDGKIILIADNSPYALIMPVFFVDFINPQGDLYVKAINVNFLKILRFICLIITIILPALYISIVNYNMESIPLNLLLSFQSARNGVPFPSAFESFFMIMVCAILRESDIRFPTNYGSSISILGALVLGEAAVNANIASPIMIIIVAITFVTGLVFNSGDIIDGIRYYRFILLIWATILGLYGLILGIFILLIHLSSLKSFNEPYLYPVAPLNKKYLFKTLLKKDKNQKNRSLSFNKDKVKE